MIFGRYNIRTRQKPGFVLDVVMNFIPQGTGEVLKDIEVCFVVSIVMQKELGCHLEVLRNSEQGMSHFFLMTKNTVV